MNQTPSLWVKMWMLRLLFYRDDITEYERLYARGEKALGASLDRPQELVDFSQARTPKYHRFVYERLDPVLWLGQTRYIGTCVCLRITHQMRVRRAASI
jgi:hypothetical protein